MPKHQNHGGEHQSKVNCAIFAMTARKLAIKGESALVYMPTTPNHGDEHPDSPSLKSIAQYSQ
jgi:hypothetical protein